MLLARPFIVAPLVRTLIGALLVWPLIGALYDWLLIVFLPRCLAVLMAAGRVTAPFSVKIQALPHIPALG